MKCYKLLTKYLFFCVVVFFKLVSCIVRFELTKLIHNIIYQLSFGGKYDLLPKLNYPFQCRYMILNYTIRSGFRHLLPIVQSQ